MLRIAVFDYPGHAFAVQLSRRLAERGHVVRHVSFADFQAPKGDLETSTADGRFESITLELGEPFQKYRFLRRRGQEIRVGRLAASAIAEHRPDIVLAGNAPIDAHRQVADYCLLSGTPMVYWLQDVNSIAIERILGQRLGPIGRCIGWAYKLIERRMLRCSAMCVAITDDFIPLLTKWRISRNRIAVIENWAPIDDIPSLAPPTAWGRVHGLTGPGTLLYAGTLSLKHDPAQLLALARRLEERGNARLVVASEGVGADYLREHGAGLASLLVMPFQPFNVFAEMLASADVLVAVLEPDAGVFSVPSKILSYFCAGRPVLASIPADNLAAKLIERNHAGLVVEPGDVAGFVAAAARLLDNPDMARDMGRNARAHAEASFAIDSVAEKFEAVFQAALAGGEISGGRLSGSGIES
jgi:colanic acid biosynthesis glycosyl transferase WcaI